MEGKDVPKLCMQLLLDLEVFYRLLNAIILMNALSIDLTLGRTRPITGHTDQRGFNTLQLVIDTHCSHCETPENRMLRGLLSCSIMASFLLF